MMPPVLPPPLPRAAHRRRWPLVLIVVSVVVFLGVANLLLIGWLIHRKQMQQNRVRWERARQEEQWRMQRQQEQQQQQFQRNQLAPGQPPDFQDRRPARRVVSTPTTTPARREKPVGPRAAAPEFSVAGGVFTNAFQVRLQAKSTNAVLRYTLNGAEPDENAPRYTAPLTISANTLLQVRAFEPGVHASPTASATYTFLDDTLRRFESNLPLVILNAHGQYVNSDRYIPASARFIRPQDGRTTLVGPADYEGRGDLKRRGFSSLRLPKMSFTFKGRDGDWDKSKASIFGLPSESDWVLYAPYSDKTLMRDVLAYEMSNLMGRYAPRTRFVEVFVSRGGSRLTMSDYAGVYVFEERITRDKNRVNIAKLKPEDNAEPAITGGYILKRDHFDSPWGGGWGRNYNGPTASGENGFTTAMRRMRLFYVEPDERDLTPQQKAWISGYMNSLERALYGPNFTSPTEGYAKYLDAESFIDHYWLVESTKNIDGFRYSCYMTKDRGGKLKIEPPWDWNLSFGNADYHDCWETSDWYYPLLRTTEVCWFSRLSQDPDFHQRHVDRWAELRTNVLDPARVNRRVDELAAQLKDAQARNFRRWPILGVNVTPNYFVGDTWQEELDYLKKWFRQRVAWIDRQFPVAPRLAEPAKGAPPAGPGDPVTLTARRGEIHFTLDGTDPRAAGGNVAKGAQRYQSPVPLGKGARLVARARDGSAWSAPFVISR